MSLAGKLAAHNIIEDIQKRFEYSFAIIQAAPINRRSIEELQQKVIYNVCDISDDFRNSERYFLIHRYEI